MITSITDGGDRPLARAETTLNCLPAAGELFLYSGWRRRSKNVRNCDPSF